MLRYKTFLLAAILAAFVLLGFVTHSDAIKILEMRPEDGYSTETTVSGNYVYHQSYVKTDKPFYDVTWYVDDEPAGYTLWSDGRNATEALFPPVLAHRQP